MSAPAEDRMRWNALAVQFGGRFHGPNVEHLSIAETDFHRLMAYLASAAEAREARLREALHVHSAAAFALTRRLSCMGTCDAKETMLCRESVMQAIMDWRRAIDALAAPAQREG